MTHERSDPLLAALSELTPLVPTTTCSDHIRARCHAAITSPVHPRRAWAGRLIDAGLVVGVALYSVSTALEALRLISFSLE